MPGEEDGLGGGYDVSSPVSKPVPTKGVDEINNSNNNKGRDGDDADTQHKFGPKPTAGLGVHPPTPLRSEHHDQSQYQHHARSASSPTLTFSRMNFYHIGIGSASPLIPLRRQFSSPYFARRRSQRVGRFRSQDFGGDGNADPDSDGNIDSSAGADKPSSEEDQSPSFSGDEGDEDGASAGEEGDGHESPADLTDEDDIPGDEGGADDAELTRDDKDILIERLSILIQRISSLPDEGGIGNDSTDQLSILHFKVDEMETALGTDPQVGIAAVNKSTSPSIRRKRPEPLPLQRRRRRISAPLAEPPRFWGSRTIAVPNWLSPTFSTAPPLFPNDLIHPGSARTLINTTTPIEQEIPIPDTNYSQPKKTPSTNNPADSKPPTPFHQQQQQPQSPSTSPSTPITDAPNPEQTALIATLTSQITDLTSQLAAVFASLQARREETEHLHALLVERAESAAERIIELEEDVAGLEDELGDGEAELKHLRLRLRAVETLCHESVVLPNADVLDPDLVRAIEEWKGDWARLRERMAGRRRGRTRREGVGLGEEVDRSLTTSVQPTNGASKGVSDITVATTPVRRNQGQVRGVVGE